MRHLPEEQDEKQHPGAGVEPAARGSPSDERGDRPGHRADHRGEGGHALERRVDRDVEQRRRLEGAAIHVDHRGDDAEDQKRDADRQGEGDQRGADLQPDDVEDVGRRHDEEIEVLERGQQVCVWPMRWARSIAWANRAFARATTASRATAR